MKTDNKTEFVDQDYLANLFGNQGEAQQQAPSAEEDGEGTDKVKEVEDTKELPKEEADNKPAEFSAEAFAESGEMSNLSVKQVITGLVKNDIWEDVALKYNDKEYNNLEELLNDTSPTKELFDELVEVQKNLHSEKLKNNYLKIDSKDDTRVKVAKAVLKGQQYEEVVAENSRVEYIKSIDITQEQNAINLLALYYRDEKNYDLDDPDAVEYLNHKFANLRKSGDLLYEAEKVKKQIVTNFEKDIERKIQAEQERQRRLEQEIRERKKQFRENLKKKEFSDTFIKKAADLRFQDHEYISLIRERLDQDEDFETDFLHFLLDKDDYDASRKQEVKYETARKMIELTGKGVRSKGKSTNTPEYDGELSPELEAKFGPQ